MAEKMSFEQARAKFLKELNGRDLAEYANDLEKEQNAKVEASMTPEYRKIWEDAAKQNGEGN